MQILACDPQTWQEWAYAVGLGIGGAVVLIAIIIGAVHLFVWWKQ